MPSARHDFIDAQQAMLDRHGFGPNRASSIFLPQLDGPTCWSPAMGPPG